MCLNVTLMLQDEGLGLSVTLGAKGTIVTSDRNWALLLRRACCTALGNTLPTVPSTHVTFLSKGSISEALLTTVCTSWRGPLDSRQSSCW